MNVGHADLKPAKSEHRTCPAIARIAGKYDVQDDGKLTSV